MSSLRIGRSHKARKALFTRGIRRGFLTVGEIDEALPPGSLTDAERWLLYYSLHAARVEVLDRRGKRVDLEDLRSSRDELRGEGEGEGTTQQ
jgi:sigma-70-like protein